MLENKNLNALLIVILVVTGVILFGLIVLMAFYPDQVDKIINMDKPQNNQNSASLINNFDECVAAGNPIMESFPAQCRTEDGRTFTQDIGNMMEKQDQIQVASPRPNQEITSPLTVVGEAKGTWYFEASFPIELYDANDQLVAQGIAQAQSDWMTEDFVRFEAEIDFNGVQTETGRLVLKKDNPSGLPKNEDSLIIPIKFNQ